MSNILFYLSVISFIVVLFSFVRMVGKVVIFLYRGYQPTRVRFNVLDLIVYAVLFWSSGAIILGVLHHYGIAYMGTLGDSMGVLNSLVSTLAFAGLVYSLIQQRQILKQQQDEITSNKTALNQQIKTQNLDRFENTFFRILPMIDVLAQEISDITVKKQGGIGLELEYGAESIKRHFRSFVGAVSIYKDTTEENRIRIASTFNEKIYNKGFRRYLDHLLSVHRYVANHEHLSFDEKRFYIDILSRSISPKVLVLYYYFYVIQIGSRYSKSEPDIFTNLDYNLLAKPEHYGYYQNPHWFG